MDRKAFLILAISFVVFVAAQYLVNELYPPLPAPGGAHPPAISTNPLPSAAEATPPATTTVPPSRLAEAPPPSTAFVRPDGPEELLAIENQEARLTFTSHGGGIQSIELKDYPETVGRGRKRSHTNQWATLNGPATVPTLALLDGAAIQGDGRFQLSRLTNGVLAVKALTNGLRIVKEFYVTNDHVVTATVRLENHGPQPLSLPPQEWVIGTATPLDRQDTGQLMGLMWYDGAKTEHIMESYFANYTLGCGCLPGNPRTEYVGGASNVVWAAAHNQFFALAAIPNVPAPRLIARQIDLPPPTAEERAADKRAVLKPFGYQTAFLYPAGVLGPREVLERKFELYLGPREYNTLARHASRLGNNLDAIMGFGWFGFFAKLLLLSMNGLHNLLGLPYGWVIIVITVLIKLLFWPLTNASTKSMKRMAALQPQMKALQEKYKDDPKKMNEKLMEFMKEHKVNPMGGCLPMILQIPVFIGFYQMLQSAIELRGARFLWVGDLSRPDTIFVIPGLEFPVNPLPLLMGVTMFWQARMTPPSPGMDPVQQAIMKYLPLMFLFLLYNFAAGLTLYWTVQNLLTIVQMKITKTQDPKAAPPGKSALPAKGPTPLPGQTPWKKK